MQRIGFVSHTDYQKHNTGAFHPERAPRLEAIVNRLKETGLLETLVPIDPFIAPIEWVTEIHTSDYVQYIEESCRRGIKALDPDTRICPLSYHVALLAVGGALAAVDSVMEGRVDQAFVAVRPPGHHAERARAMGFCLFNNIAIATRYLQKHYHLERILIVDWDVHHGNGTQHAFEEDPSVFFFSIHQYPHYPGTGSSEERGKGAGFGFTVNVPVPAGSGDKEYILHFEKTLYPQALAFCPDFVLISAGFDAHKDDPLCATLVTEQGFQAITEMVGAIARECCQGRLVSLLEGGYSLDALSRSVEQHLRTLQRLA